MAVHQAVADSGFMVLGSFATACFAGMTFLRVVNILNHINKFTFKCKYKSLNSSSVIVISLVDFK